MFKRIHSFIFICLCCVLASCIGDEYKTDDYTDEIRIALISDPVYGNDQFLLQAYHAYTRASEQYKFLINHVEVKSPTEWINAVHNLAEQGFNLIIGIGWQAGEAFTPVQKMFPETNFVVIDTLAPSPNIRSFTYEVLYGAYLYGVMIGHAFPYEQVYGYIGNFQNQSNYEYRYGFTQGVLSVNPKAEFLFDFANSYSDLEIVRTLAHKQSIQGARFIMGSVSSHANMGIFTASREVMRETNEPIYTSGLTVDCTSRDTPFILGGLTKNTRIPVERVIDELYATGTIKVGHEVLKLGDGFGVLYFTESEYNYLNTDILNSKVFRETQRAYENILNGNIDLTMPNEFNIKN